MVNQAAASILPSLGASGAIYSCVIITALGFPEAQVSLFIPPTYPIPIQWGVGGLLALDITGVLRGGRFVNVYSMSLYTDRVSITGCLTIGRTWEELLLASRTTTTGPHAGIG